MSADPRTLAANLEEFTAWYRDNPEPGIPGVVPPMIKSAGQVVRAVVVPLHDAWLKANPPCPNPSHSIECPWTYNDGMEDHVYRCSHPCGHSGHHRASGTYPVSWDSDALGARLVVCPDCPDGVLPFDKWTAGLVALWTAVHTTNLELATTDHRNAYEYLRQIGAR